MNRYTYTEEFDPDKFDTQRPPEPQPYDSAEARAERRRRNREREQQLAELQAAEDARGRRRRKHAADYSDSDMHQRKPTSDRELDEEDLAEERKSSEELPGFIAKPIAFFRDKSTRMILGVALLLLTCYLGVAAISFLAHNNADQSRVTSETLEQLATQPDSIENISGSVGAKTSHHLFVEGLGVGSVVLIVYLALLGLALLGVKKIKFWSLTFRSLLIAITISIVLGLLTLGSDASIPLGGYHGRDINRMMIPYIGLIGTVFVSIMLVAIVAALYLTQLISFYKKSRERIRLMQAKRELEQEREQYVNDRVEEALSEGPINGELPEEESTATTAEVLCEEINLAAGETHKAEESADNHAIAVSGMTSDPIVTPTSNPLAASTASETPSESTNLQKEEAAANTNGDPDFAVTCAQEIEQGGKENEAYKVQGPYDPKAELSQFKMPTVQLLHDRKCGSNSVDLEEQEANKQKITRVLGDYGIEIVKIEAIVGPTVTLYKIVPAAGERIAKIKRLEDDIAMSLAALGIRIIAPIPGESNIGIEVPNKEPQTVSIRSILGSKAFQDCRYALPMALGATINGEVFIADLAKMPHLLVAGATGQGKSVGLNTIIASLLYKRHPSELKFVLVDPKMVEFSLYKRLETHYLAKIPDAEDAIITDWTKVVDTLNSLCVEMDKRYELLKEAECRSITEYNDKFIRRKLNPEKGHRYLPYIVMIVDEFADLIMMAGKSVETPIARIAQKARAVGMHLIIATQRPSTNVITGMIKANFPGRIAFAVRQRVDSQTILDCPGANQLIGRGDMLISSGGPLQRVQCAFIDTDEVEAICHYIDDQAGFPTAYILPDPPTEASEGGGSSMGSLSERDPLFDEIARMIVQNTTASTSNIQRKYSIGYNRAGKIMDQMEAAGIVGPATGGKPRQVLMSPEDVEMLLSTL